MHMALFNSTLLKYILSEGIREMVIAATQANTPMLHADFTEIQMFFRGKHIARNLSIPMHNTIKSVISIDIIDTTDSILQCMFFLHKNVRL